MKFLSAAVAPMAAAWQPAHLSSVGMPVKDPSARKLWQSSHLEPALSAWTLWLKSTGWGRLRYSALGKPAQPAPRTVSIPAKKTILPRCFTVLSFHSHRARKIHGTGPDAARGRARATRPAQTLRHRRRRPAIPGRVVVAGIRWRAAVHPASIREPGCPTANQPW